MQILLSVGIACMLVVAQVLWKLATTQHSFELSTKFVQSRQFTAFLLSPKLIGGILLYGVATLFYFQVLAKYEYYSVQAVVLPTALVLALLVQTFFFKVPLSPTIILGTILLLAGVFLVLKS